MIAADSLVMSLDAGRSDVFESSASVRASRRESAALGATRWASPPPGLSRNWVYLPQLGLLLAVGLIIAGARMAGA